VRAVPETVDDTRVHSVAEDSASQQPIRPGGGREGGGVMAERLGFVDQKMRDDPDYAPYCMRCPGLRRMRRVSPTLAECPVCPAVHDIERDTPNDQAKTPQ